MSRECVIRQRYGWEWHSPRMTCPSTAGTEMDRQISTRSKRAHQPFWEQVFYSAGTGKQHDHLCDLENQLWWEIAEWYNGGREIT